MNRKLNTIGHIQHIIFTLIFRHDELIFVWNFFNLFFSIYGQIDVCLFLASPKVFLKNRLRQTG